MLRYPPMIASTFPDRIEGDQVVPDCLGWDLLSGQVAGVQQRVVEGVVAGDAREPHGMPADLAEAGDRDLRRDDEAVEGDGHDRGDGYDRQALLLAVEHLWFVGDRKVGLVKPDELERVSGAGRDPEGHGEVLPGEVSLGLRIVEADVIGVGHPVELDGE